MSSRAPEVSRSCWSCRLLSGGALLGSAGFVYRSARTSLHRGARAPVGAALQLAFAAGLAVWGLVVIVEPVSKNPQKSTGP
ncbi:distal membrane-arm assembly complex protein 1 [Pangasianodon hypophthalmus]|uniref:distal membrane-arm assembly complex protein 1 n=1 Tax=Pangasianodon hypophthalmus TaxID=310915 RepID=UPI002307CBCC|nr:distal membrane-arm assembly complex protein 1 [Pangasianodon hypophthalmus]